VLAGQRLGLLKEIVPNRAARPSGRAPNEVRPDHQSKNREINGPRGTDCDARPDEVIE
jgi:hypothetical protein